MQSKKLLATIYAWLILYLWLFPSSVYAVPLTEADIINASRIIIYHGVFDPITKAHVDKIKKTFVNSVSDIIIVVPEVMPQRVDALPVRIRLKLIASTLADDQQIRYLSLEGHDRFFQNGNVYFDQSWPQRLRELNPKLKIDLLTSGTVLDSTMNLLRPDRVAILEDRVTNDISQNVRDFFVKNKELYFRETISDDSLPAELDERVARFILENGLYLTSTDSVNSYDIITEIKRNVRGVAHSILHKLNLYDRFKKLSISRLPNDAVSSIQVGEQHLPVKKQLGSGMNAQTYLVEYNGRDVAIKIARNKSSMAIDVISHKWLETKTKIRVPTLYLADQSGAWQIYEYVEGETLDKYFQRTTDLERELISELRNLHSEVLRIAEEQNFLVDFAPDNIMVKGHHVYLVDMGPMGPGSRKKFIEPTFAGQMQRWQEAFWYKENQGPRIHFTERNECLSRILMTID